MTVASTEQLHLSVRPGHREAEGATLEVITGLKEGETVIIHPGDDLAEGTKVQPIARDKPKGKCWRGQPRPGAKRLVVEGVGNKWHTTGGQDSSNANQGQASQSAGATEKQTSTTR